MPQNRLRELYQAHGWTLEEFADWAGVSIRQVYRWETGENRIPIDRAAQLSDFFGVSLDHLMGRDRPADENDAEPVAC